MEEEKEKEETVGEDGERVMKVDDEELLAMHCIDSIFGCRLFN